MTEKTVSIEPPESILRPRGIFARLLTLVAFMLAVVMAVLAYSMATPVRWDSSIGVVGALALSFPLHLLVVSVVAAVLAWLAKRFRAWLAMLLFCFVVVLTAVMAIKPTLAIRAKAKELNVPVSLGNYFAHATHMNFRTLQAGRTMRYGTAKDGTKLELDVWRTSLPNTGPLRPALVFVHGGAWIHGTRSMFPEWDKWFNELGYEVFDVEYRMPPPVRWQDEIGDVKAALGWVVAHAAEYHVDPARITLMGNSAGGNLAMLAAYSAGHAELPPSTDVPPVTVHNVISLYGPCDTALQYRLGDSTDLVQAAMKQYIGGSPEEFPDRYRLLSPLHHIGPKTPPTIMLLGTCDRIVRPDQSIALDEALTKAGVSHENYLLPASDHAFDVNWGGFTTQIARAKIEDFLQFH